MMFLSITSATDREIMAEVGLRLRRLRKHQKLTIIEAARLAGLDRTTVSRAERGASPNLSTIIRLLRVYGRLPALESFAPDPEISPMARLRDRQSRNDG